MSGFGERLGKSWCADFAACAGSASIPAMLVPSVRLPVFAGAALAFAALSFAAPALAQGSAVVVLGVRSVEGDDDVAHDLTNALRESAQAVGTWQVSPTAVSMAQMALAHGCEEVDASCLADIAKGLRADLVVYGTLRRSSAREDYDFAFNLNLFDAASGAIVRGVDDTIPRNQTTKGSLGPRAKRLIGRLSGTGDGSSLGSISVESNVAGADVLINEQPVGSLENGALQFEGLQAGAYRVEVRTHGYAPYVTTVQVKDGQQAHVKAELHPGSSERDPMAEWEDSGEAPNVGHGQRWLGWTLIGVGGAALIGTAISWVEIVTIDQDDRLARYSDLVATSNRLAAARGEPLVEDFCEPAAAGITYAPDGVTSSELQDVQDLCSKADLWEVLQYVFLGTAVVAGAGGVIVLMTAGDRGVERASTDSSELPRFALQPKLGMDHAAVSATLRF